MTEDKTRTELSTEEIAGAELRPGYEIFFLKPLQSVNECWNSPVQVSSTCQLDCSILQEISSVPSPKVYLGNYLGTYSVGLPTDRNIKGTL